MIVDLTLLNRIAGFAALLGGLFCFQANAGEAQTLEFRGAEFFIYRIDPATEKLELFLRDKNNQPILTFAKLEQQLNAEGKQLKFALNSGIYEPTFLPTGLHISEGKTIVPLNQKEAPEKSLTGFTPNFYLKPNGVFFIRKDGTAKVMATQFYAKAEETPRLATQSGPLLLANGKTHPIFEENSSSRLIRNGVGVDSKGRIVFACSDRTPDQGRINLWGFAALFRDQLDCKDALYLDGDISAIYIRGRHAEIPKTNWFAGILAVVEEKPAKP